MPICFQPRLCPLRACPPWSRKPRSCPTPHVHLLRIAHSVIPRASSVAPMRARGRHGGHVGGEYTCTNNFCNCMRGYGWGLDHLGRGQPSRGRGAAAT
eukprot:8893069-Alexandrium_andersonii.AAC.1